MGVEYVPFIVSRLPVYMFLSNYSVIYYKKLRSLESIYFLSVSVHLCRLKDYEWSSEESLLHDKEIIHGRYAADFY